MARRVWMLIPAVGLIVAGARTNAAGMQFQWHKDQTLDYRVEQTTTVTETVEGKTRETSTKVKDVKHWLVLDVDGAGVATLQMSLLSLRIETNTPTGETMVFDSAKPAESNEQMREQLSAYVGKPLALVRVDPRGRVVEVKECNFGPASKFENEPPFVLTLPEDGLQPGQSWERPYQLTLDPPLGAGEKYQALQKYECRAVQDGAATVALATMVKNPPANVRDQLPLFQVQPGGGAVFNTQAGRMERAYLRIEKEVKDHEGAGSSYRFQSIYSEEYVSNR